MHLVRAAQDIGTTIIVRTELAAHILTKHREPALAPCLYRDCDCPGLR